MCICVLGVSILRVWYISFLILFQPLIIVSLQVNWRPVFWGLEIQFYFALIILRWEFGNDIFQWCGDRVTEFLAHTDAGSKFLFGTAYTNHFFAFAVSKRYIQSVLKDKDQWYFFSGSTHPTFYSNLFIFPMNEAKLSISNINENMSSSLGHK